MTNQVDSSYLLSTFQSQSRKPGKDILGKDDFLKILMTQLQNQDPLNPMQDKDFIAQMATFSSLEQMTNMTKALEQSLELQKQNSLISYNHFVGKEVTWHKLIESENGLSEPKLENGVGKVTSIQFKDNQVYFILEDGLKLEPGNISQLGTSNSDSQFLQSSMLIGKKITYLDTNNNEKVASVQSVSYKLGKSLFELNDEAKTKITAQQIVKIE